MMELALPVRRRSSDGRINLKSNELIHPRADEILRSVAQRIGSSEFRRYPATAEIVSALAGYFNRSASECVVTPGSNVAIHLICRTWARMAVNAPRKLLLQWPNYEGWEEAANLNQLQIQRFAAADEHNEAQIRHLLLAAEQEEAALLAISSPNGPAGGRTPDSLLDKLTDVALRRNHLFVMDACYQAFDGPLDHHVRLIDKGALVVQTLSKSHALAGARVSLLFGAPRLLANLHATSLEHAVAGSSLLAARALVDHHADLSAIWVEIREIRDQLAGTLRTWGLYPLPSQGNFLSVRMGDVDGAAALTAALGERNYRVRDLSDLPGLEGCIRFTVGDAETMKNFLPCLETALSERQIA